MLDIVLYDLLFLFDVYERNEGVRGLFHGLSPTFAREMPGYFCFFFAYEFTRELLTPQGNILQILDIVLQLLFSSYLVALVTHI